MARVSASTRYVRELQARGFNYAQIGKVAGVNRSLIRQIGLGEKPGRNLTPALRALAKSDSPPPKRGQAIEGVKVPEPKHKTTASGERAPVRQRERAAGKVPAGEATVVERRTAKAGMNAIKRAAARGHNVKVTIKFAYLEEYKGREQVRNASVELFGRGGEDAQRVLETLDVQEGSLEKAFAGLVSEVLGGRVGKVQGFQGIDVYSFPVNRPH